MSLPKSQLYSANGPSTLVSTGSYLPARVVTNVDLEASLTTSDAWIRDHTGIAERRLAGPDEAASDLAVNAARAAMSAIDPAVPPIDLIVVATFTADSPLPSAAVRIQHRLGLTRVPAFDVSAACAGFLFALTIGDQFLRLGTYRTVLLVGVEVLSRVVNWNDRATAVLFGDGAGAAILTQGELAPRGTLELVASVIASEGHLADAIQIPAGGSREPLTAASIEAARGTMRMTGTEFVRTAIKRLVEIGREAAEKAGITIDQIDHFIPHQANLRILESVAARWGISMDKMVLIVGETGNVSSASIPIAMDRAVRAGKIKPGDWVLSFAFGSGVSYGAAVFRAKA